MPYIERYKINSLLYIVNMYLQCTIGDQKIICFKYQTMQYEELSKGKVPATFKVLYRK